MYTRSRVTVCVYTVCTNCRHSVYKACTCSHTRMVGYLKGFVKARKTPFENLCRNYSNVTLVRGLDPGGEKSRRRKKVQKNVYTLCALI